MSTTFNIPPEITRYINKLQAGSLAKISYEEAWNGNSNLDELARLAKRTYVHLGRGHRRWGWQGAYIRGFVNRMQEMVTGMATEDPTLIHIRAKDISVHEAYLYHEGPNHITLFSPDANGTFADTAVILNGSKMALGTTTDPLGRSIERRLRPILLKRVAFLRKQVKANPELLKEIENLRGAKKMVAVVGIVQELSACRGSINTLLEGIDKESLTKQSLDNFFDLIRKLSAKKGAIRRDLKKIYGT